MARAASSLSAEISPELLGVGYIIGPRVASVMCAGGVLAYLVLIPAIKFFGGGMTEALALDLALPTRRVLERLKLWLALSEPERSALEETPVLLRDRGWLME